MSSYGRGPQAYREATEGKGMYVEPPKYEGEGMYVEPPKYEGEGNPAEAAARQVGGNHYNRHTIQPWDIIDEYGLDFYRGNAIKYILRNKMDTREDIEKAKHYLEKWLEATNA